MHRQRLDCELTAFQVTSPLERGEKTQVWYQKMDEVGCKSIKVHPQLRGSGTSLCLDGRSGAQCFLPGYGQTLPRSLGSPWASPPARSGHSVSPVCGIWHKNEKTQHRQ